MVGMMDPSMARNIGQDIMMLAEGLAQLSQSIRETRTMLWSALQATQLLDVDKEIASGKRPIESEAANENSLVEETKAQNDELPLELEG